MASSELSLLATFLLCLLCTLPSIYKAITTRLQRYHLDNKLNLADSTATATPSPDINEVAVEKESPFSRDWFTSPSIYKLERRAVFSTNWHNVTHISNLPFPGSYLTPPPIGGYPIFLIRGKDDTVRAFHNVCRHRAYEVTRKECGKSLVLGCRYHGWSYDTKGKLVKAPEFEGVEGFSKDANSLWEIATRMRDGSIEVCLDSTMVGDGCGAKLRNARRGPRVRRDWLNGKSKATSIGSSLWVHSMILVSLSRLQFGPKSRISL